MGHVPYNGHVYLLPWRWRQRSLLSRGSPTSSLLPPVVPCSGHIGMLDVERGSRNRRREQRREGSRTGTRKKNTNFNYAFIYNRNKGLLTGPQQRVLPGKPTGIFRLTSGESQCKWWCVNGTSLKTEEKYGTRVALSFDLPGASSFLSQF